MYTFSPDANTLLFITNKCLRSRNFINVIVAGKHPEIREGHGRVKEVIELLFQLC